MARPRKTVEEHIAAGTFRADRHAKWKATDKPAEVGALAPPAELPAEALAVWRLLAPLVEGGSQPRDLPVLGDLCIRWAELRRVQTAIAGMPVTAEEYPALVRCSTALAAQVDRLVVRFGLTPQDRERLGDSIPAPKSEPAKVIPLPPPLSGWRAGYQQPRTREEYVEKYFPKK